ncbi:MAG: lasso peptide biosynthesis B2 protein [Erythrobacter sp.]
MNLAQSPHIPAEGQKPKPKDILWLLRYGLRGLWELVRARVIFARLEAKAIPERNRESKNHAAVQPNLGDAQLDRIIYVLPRISDRLPWRSDCLVQAVAAQNWLSTFGAASEIQIGVELPNDSKNGEFGAHAWLLYKERVVTGGDIAQYHLILSDSRMKSDSDAKDGSESRN